MTSFFQDKVVIVTGSSNGIGRGVAEKFASLGAKLTITGRNETTLGETKELLKKAGCKDADICEIIGDLSNDEIAQQVINKTVEQFGRIDVLVNNAGGTTGDADKHGFDIGMEHYDYTMKLNVRTMVLLSRLATPHLLETKGAIVNVSSIAATPVCTDKLNPYYAISKAAVDQVTVQLAGRLAPLGVRVNCVNPGVIRTDIFRKIGLSTEQHEQFFEENANPKLTPIGRCGLPQDIANLIVFLADRTQSEFIVGQRILIDGGAFMRNQMLSNLMEGFI